MATHNDTAREQRDMKERPTGRLLGHQRVAAMLEATYQAEALHDLLARVLARLPDLDDEADRVQLRRQAEALLRRLGEINSVLMSGLDDPMETAKDLQGRLQGALPTGRGCFEWATSSHRSATASAES